VEPLFEFLGYVPDLAPALSESALLIITSRSEGIPLVLLEAFASGKPVVAANVGAIEEVLDDKTGFLIDPGNKEIESFATAIDVLLSNPHLRTQMGLAGRQKVEKDHAKTHSMQAYRELFELLSNELALTP
jgi:glycosyltransferase involved in cell wall biosynthesis